MFSCIVLLAALVAAATGQTCFGLPASDPSVCSGAGDCIGLDTCDCDEGVGGDQCELFTCYNINYTDPAVCSGHGDCVGVDVCACTDYYTGDECEIAQCFGLSANDPAVCSGHGDCVGLDNCTCDEGYAPPFDPFSVPYPCIESCGGIPGDNPSVCSSHGACLAPDTCDCFDQYSGPVCEDPPCVGVSADDPSVCNGHGNCTTDEFSGGPVCVCEPGYSLGFLLPVCYPVCFGWVGEEGSGACSGHGDCIAPNTCNCDPVYEGTECEIAPCFGYSASDPNVCNGHGICASADVCECEEGYSTGFFDNNCYVTCFGTPLDFPDVCSGHGDCVGLDNCTCDEGYAGAACDMIVCDGLFPFDPLVCSGHGTCVGANVCTCDPGYGGDFCDRFACYGEINPDACSGENGTCDSPDFCTCEEGYEGSQCDLWRCGGTLVTDPGVCSSNGVCLGPDDCLCDPEWAGDNCDSFFCFGEADPEACGGERGACVGTDTCECRLPWTGADCTTPSPYDIPAAHNPLCYGEPPLAFLFMEFQTGDCSPIVWASSSWAYSTAIAPVELLGNLECQDSSSGGRLRFIGDTTVGGLVLSDAAAAFGATHSIWLRIFWSSGSYIMIPENSLDPNAGLLIQSTAGGSCVVTLGGQQLYDRPIACPDEIVVTVEETTVRVFDPDGRLPTSDIPLTAGRKVFFPGGTVVKGSGIRLVRLGYSISPLRTDAQELDAVQTGNISSPVALACGRVGCDSEDVCSARGACVEQDTCWCGPGSIGPNCEDPVYCNGIPSFDDSSVSPFACSGHGDCVYEDQCDCDCGWTGENCEIPPVVNCPEDCQTELLECIASVFSIPACVPSSGSPCESCTAPCGDVECFALCFTEGNCSNSDFTPECDFDVCVTQNEACLQACSGGTTSGCPSGYCGEDCDVPLCDPGCSNGGSCTAPSNCSCIPPWYGPTCEFYNSPIDCNGNGLPGGLHYIESFFDVCLCDDGYFGDHCDLWSCYGVNNTDPGACNNYGNSCDGPDTCVCSGDWTGDDCSTPVCSSGCPDGECTSPGGCTCDCHGRGSCDSSGLCECDAGWRDDTKCALPDCDLTCFNGGKCGYEYDSLNRLCKCVNGYYGPSCEWGPETTCETPVDCSGHGVCHEATEGLEECVCYGGWTGANCEIPPESCDKACTSHGTCVEGDPETCCCETGWVGEFCETELACVPTCVNGNCVWHIDSFFDVYCDCQEGWQGEFCNVPKCPDDCSSHGSCVGPNTCSCDAGWTEASHCAMWECAPSCQNGGVCTGPNECACLPGWEGPTCEVDQCSTFGCVFGTCVGENECLCQEGYFGPSCNEAECDPCCKNGVCIGGVCSCEFGWEGPDCGTPICGGDGCNGHGICTAPDLCSCDPPYEGSLCQYERNTCFGITVVYETSQAYVCSGHGTCLGPDTCYCDEYWSGPECGTTTLPSCFGVHSTNETVCSDHGDCIDEDVCDCEPHWTGDNCDESTKSVCFGKDEDDEDVCSGHGDCVFDDECWCYHGWNGTECELEVDFDETYCCDPPQVKVNDVCRDPVCFGMHYLHPGVCGKKRWGGRGRSNGVCVDMDTCDCHCGYWGDRCQHFRGYRWFKKNCVSDKPWKHPCKWRGWDDDDD